MNKSIPICVALSLVLASAPVMPSVIVANASVKEQDTEANKTALEQSKDNYSSTKDKTQQVTTKTPKSEPKQDAQTTNAEPSQEAQATDAEPKQEAQATDAEPKQEAQATDAEPKQEAQATTEKPKADTYPSLKSTIKVPEAKTAKNRVVAHTATDKLPYTSIVDRSRSMAMTIDSDGNIVTLADYLGKEVEELAKELEKKYVSEYGLGKFETTADVLDYIKEELDSANFTVDESGVTLYLSDGKKMRIENGTKDTAKVYLEDSTSYSFVTDEIETTDKKTGEKTVEDTNTTIMLQAERVENPTKKVSTTKKADVVNITLPAEEEESTGYNTIKVIINKNISKELKFEKAFKYYTAEYDPETKQITIITNREETATYKLEEE